MSGFAASIRRQIVRVQLEIDYKINRVFFLAGNYAVKKSPRVGDGPYVSGHFVNNWFPAANGYATTVDNSTNPDGADSLLRIASIVTLKTFYRRDGMLSLSNNVSYGANIEYKGWPKGYDPATGWNWTGKRIIYAPVAHTALYMKTIT